MEVREGRRYIEKYFDERTDLRISEKIELFSAHGINITEGEGEDGGPNIYREWMNKRNDVKYEKLEKKLDKDKEIKTDDNIEDIIKAKQNGRKTTTNSNPGERSISSLFQAK